MALTRIWASIRRVIMLTPLNKTYRALSGAALSGLQSYKKCTSNCQHIIKTVIH